MNLIDIVNDIENLDVDSTIFAKPPWLPTSAAQAVVLDETYKTPTEIDQAGLEYFLEVHVAKEVLGVFGQRSVTQDEKFRLLSFYAENDAYPDWVYEK